MLPFRLAVAILFSVALYPKAPQQERRPLRVAIIGLVHGHVAGFLNGGALTPAGGALHRADVQVVGVVEPDDQLFRTYADRYHWPDTMRFRSIDDLALSTHPDAALVFTSTAG